MACGRLGLKLIGGNDGRMRTGDDCDFVACIGQRRTVGLAVKDASSALDLLLYVHGVVEVFEVGLAAGAGYFLSGGSGTLRLRDVILKIWILMF